MNDSIDTPSESTPSLTPSLTPLMKQYWELKEQAQDALLLFRMGDFYELFGDDAITASRILEITLTARDKNRPNPTPMAGVPFHSLETYLPKLLNAGKKVAIGEQMEEATSGKGIVRREIVRIFTPAIQFSGENSELRFCVTCEVTSLTPLKNEYTCAFLEASTGDLFYHTCSTFEALLEVLQSMPIAHFIFQGNAHTKKELLPLHSFFQHKENILWEELPHSLSFENAQKILASQLEVAHTSQPFFEHPATVRTLAFLIRYLLESQKTKKLHHLKMPEALHDHAHLTLGARTSVHLDLLPTQDGTPHLFQWINKTHSSSGARLLKKWIQTPLKNKEAIEARQKAIQDLSKNILIQKKFSDLFSTLYDLERILSRVNTRLASPRDTLTCATSLSILPDCLHLLDSLFEKTETPSALLTHIYQELQKCTTHIKPLYEKIISSQKEEAPLHTREGGIFKSGVDEKLDHYIRLNEDGHQFLLEFERKEREATGIQKLRVKYNRVYGYYIEITHGNVKNVPAHYQRKQSTVNSERYFTEELKKYEEEFLQASHKQKILEQELFEKLLQEIAEQSQPIFQVSHLFSELDVLTSFSYFAQLSSWCFPELDHSFDLMIQKGRHPLVEASLKGSYVPNTISLSPHTQLTLLVTGPNMGGKSTFMRQVALLILLGQMGAPIPAQKARWGIFHSLYTRLGAHDQISKGQSTFMVEMSELASILHQANERSFILLDEIGRGTSTYDGMSVAWAALEWICKKIKARTLFATHYHELTRLSQELPQLKNVHMAVQEGATAQDLRFLYEVKDGPSHQSFGIHVAEIAGVPKPITQRAWALLKELEQSSTKTSKQHRSQNKDQLTLFDSIFETKVEEQRPGLTSVQPTPEPPEWMKNFLELDLLNLPPLEALQKIHALQQKAQRAGS